MPAHETHSALYPIGGQCHSHTRSRSLVPPSSELREVRRHVTICRHSQFDGADLTRVITMNRVRLSLHSREEPWISRRRVSSHTWSALIFPRPNHTGADRSVWCGFVRLHG